MGGLVLKSGLRIVGTGAAGLLGAGCGLPRAALARTPPSASPTLCLAPCDASPEGPAPLRRQPWPCCSHTSARSCRGLAPLSLPLPASSARRSHVPPLPRPRCAAAQRAGLGGTVQRRALREPAPQVHRHDLLPVHGTGGTDGQPRALCGTVRLRLVLRQVHHAHHRAVRCGGVGALRPGGSWEAAATPPQRPAMLCTLLGAALPTRRRVCAGLPAVCRNRRSHHHPTHLPGPAATATAIARPPACLPLQATWLRACSG